MRRTVNFRARQKDEMFDGGARRLLEDRLCIREVGHGAAARRRGRRVDDSVNVLLDEESDATAAQQPAESVLGLGRSLACLDGAALAESLDQQLRQALALVNDDYPCHRLCSFDQPSPAGRQLTSPP